MPSEEVDGYMSRLIAGEEPELCIRLRKSGWKIWRIDVEMAQHDADIKKISQWWKRSIRTGYVYAERAYLHSSPSERYKVKQFRSPWIWTIAIPLSVVLLALLGTGRCGLFLLTIYPAQILRLTLKGNRTLRDNFLYALFLLLGRFPEMLGQCKFFMHRYRRGQARLIEYK